MTLQEAVQQGTKLFAEAGIRPSRLTAEVLLSHAIGCRREWLYGHSTDQLTELWWIHYGRYLHQRLKGTPTQYITQVQEFYGRDFRVSPAVLIPRPETEHLIEAALQRLPPKATLIDVGTGSGAIAITLAFESNARVYASDVSSAALAIAVRNAAKCRVTFLLGDTLTMIARRSMDMVVSNPPYIPEAERDTLPTEVRDHEPHLALFGGRDGLDVYKKLVYQASEVLKPNGWLLLELAYNGAAAVQALLDDRWQAIEIIPDLAGHPRVLAAQLTPRQS